MATDLKNVDALQALVNNNSEFVLQVYANWCGHCKNLAPQYDALAQQQGGSVPVVKIDAAEIPQTTQVVLPNGRPVGDFVRGYPTVFHFQGAHGVTLDKRDAAGLQAGIDAHNTNTQNVSVRAPAATPASTSQLKARLEGLRNTYSNMGMLPPGIVQNRFTQ
ncbi:MAG: hypothetical protein CL902_00495 [Dehalococcoidia bacterium]|nr:hypothetical protein [Dehalococcoidia bacterium]